MKESITVFKSQICHTLKEMGDIDFMLDILKKDSVRDAWNKKRYFEAFYILGMLDYLSRINEIPLCTRYDDIRKRKLSNPVYPTGMVLMRKAVGYCDTYKPIREFSKFNIYEYDIRDVC